MTEKQLEKAIREKATALGYLTYKFTSPSNAGVPDRIFINKHGYIFFIEFKSKTGKLTSLQKKVHEDFGNRRVNVYVIDDFIIGVRILKVLENKRYIALTNYVERI